MKTSQRMNRRQFIATTALSAGAASLLDLPSTGSAQTGSTGKNPFPRWRGFNLTDFFSPNPPRSGEASRNGTTDDELQWIVDWGFDFIRLPMAYPRYVEFDRSRRITPEEVCKIDERAADRIEAFVRKVQDKGLHVSLNLHRAPGYCINAGFFEPYNLWQSKEAQEAFNFHWAMWAKRFKDVSPGKVSFDLLNEPALRADMNDQHSSSREIPGQLYRTVAKGAVDAIRAANPNHLVIADGNRVGTQVTPELKDLNIGQSCRGYYPGAISHYKAPWANKDPEKCATPVWPGTMNGEHFDRAKLEKHYQPWIELANSGVGVHCGECGCWNKTPHAVFLAWISDVLGILTSHKIGYALWNFRGDFGILDSRREDIEYQDWHGHKLDAKLLEVLKRH
jgi:aryl-phospho-beta-D-glucosidase BglC (GH1 family)